MRRTSALVVFLLVSVMSGVTGARPKELAVVLKWNPNEKQSVPVFETTGGVLPLVIAEVSDKRERGKQIGENTEEKVAVPVYTASDVPAYVREHLTAQLRAIGLAVTTGDTGERIMRLELVEFWVAEGNRYRGSVRLRVSVTDSQGKELWSALVGGASDNFGRSLKPDNYTESVSDAMQDLAARLIAATGFRDALAQRQ
jgi:hypothetical protein